MSEMAEMSERRISEWAKEPARVLPAGAGAAALDVARKVLACQAMLQHRKTAASGEDDDL